MDCTDESRAEIEALIPRLPRLSTGVYPLLDIAPTKDGRPARIRRSSGRQEEGSEEGSRRLQESLVSPFLSISRCIGTDVIGVGSCTLGEEWTRDRKSGEGTNGWMELHASFALFLVLDTVSRTVARRSAHRRSIARTPS